jgi:hypothetical protein
MPSNGLSLVGFMTDQQQALNHLKLTCILGSKTDAQLIADWRAAQGRLGVAIPNAGQPGIQPIPLSHQAHLQQAPLVQVLAMYPGASFQRIEVAPLLAFQFTVDTDRVAHHCASLSHPPTLDELLALCLPVNPQQEPLQAVPQAQSIIVKSRSLNVRIQGAGIMNFPTPQGQVQAIGAQFGVALPFVQVTRFNGRYYLHNGFHRAYGALLAGATHLPSIVRDVQTYQEVGIRDDGGTFDLALLQSNNPPTLGHFAGRSVPVLLRLTSRIIHVSWSEYVVLDE